METAAGIGPGRRELIDLLAAIPDPDVVDTVVQHGPVLVARLLPLDWEALAVRLRGADGLLPGAFAWRAGYALHQFGRYDEARCMFDDADTAGLPDIDAALLSAAESATAWAQGRHEVAHEAAQEAMRIAESTRDDRALAAAWIARALVAAMVGDRGDNRASYLIALEHAVAAGDDLARVRILNNLASAELEEGRYGAALERLEDALSCHDPLGHRPMLALLRHNMAEALLGLGRLDEALVEAEASRSIMGQVDSPWNGSAWQLIGDVQAARGNVAQAMHGYRQAVEVAEREGDAQSLVPALAGLAKSSIADDPVAALDLVDRLFEQRATQGHVAGMLAAGWIHLHSDDRDQALFYADQARAEATRRGDLTSVADGCELAVLASTRSGDDPRLVEALEIWDRTGNAVRRQTHLLLRASLSGRTLAEQVARQQLRRLGVHDDARGIAGPLRAVARCDPPTPPAATVVVQVLGSFSVHRGATPVEPGEWPSRKARDVLRVLAGRGERGITREELAELIWPGTPATGNRLSIALSQVRSVLDPAKEHPADHFVQADRFTVRLHPLHVACDLADFRLAAAEALTARRRGDDQAVLLLEAAAALYTADVAIDETADDATLRLVDEVRGIGQELTRALAFSLADAAEPERALPWLNRLLNDDPYDEPTYARIISLLLRQRRHGEARRYYTTYRLRMDELGVPATAWEQMGDGGSPGGSLGGSLDGSPDGSRDGSRGGGR